MTVACHSNRLLLLIPTTSYRAGDFMEAAAKLGIEVAVGSDRNSVLEQFDDALTTTVDLYHLEEGVRQIRAYAERHPIRAIVPVDDETTLLAARAAESLGLPHNPPDAVAASVDKHRFRSRLANSGLPAPWFSLVSLKDDPAPLSQSMTYPCVLKPLSLSASRGVIRADTPAAFTEAFERIRKLLDQPDVRAKGKDDDRILVEGYIPGIEVALEGMLAGGRLNVLAIFDKPDPLEGPFFEETIYVTPSRLDANRQKEIVTTAEKTIRAIGLNDGPVHAEFRLNEQGVWPLEIGARTIGGLCARALRFGTGVSLEEIVLKHALNATDAILKRESAAAGVMMIPVPQAGTLEGVAGLEEAKAVPGIEDATISVPLGREVVPWPEGHQYLGFIFARGETPEAVERGLREAHRRLRFEIA